MTHEVNLTQDRPPAVTMQQDKQMSNPQLLVGSQSAEGTWEEGKSPVLLVCVGCLGAWIWISFPEPKRGPDSGGLGA